MSDEKLIIGSIGFGPEYTAAAPQVPNGEVFFVQSGPMPENNAKAILSREHEKGWNEAIEIAAQHVEAQTAVWGHTGVPISHVIQTIANNLRHFKRPDFDYAALAQELRKP